MLILNPLGRLLAEGSGLYLKEAHRVNIYMYILTHTHAQMAVVVRFPSVHVLPHCLAVSEPHTASSDAPFGRINQLTRPSRRAEWLIVS